MSVLKAVKLNDSIVLLAAQVNTSEVDKNKLAIYLLKGDKITSKTILKPKEYMNYQDVIPMNKGILVTGSIFTDDDLEQDYITYFDFKGDCKWNLGLEKKYEGIFRLEKTSDGIIALSSGNEGLFSYEINYKGVILKKEQIPVGNYLIDAFINKDEHILITSVVLNNEGETVNWDIHLFNSNLELIAHNSPGFPDAFTVEDIIETDENYLIVGDVELNNALIPQSYTIDKDLQLSHSASYHYQPAYYKFKSNFQLNDISLIKSKNLFIASGVTKVVNDETNIIFLIDEYSMINHKMLDLSGGIWKNNNVIVRDNNQVVVFEDVLKPDGFNTYIKKVNLKITE
ncbi:hypothetical protein DF185_05220 [Marinifilum breve]|uniref:Uncharacterized protein n=1 Tax=Marinifilum breve TaxID=2184082 RepID=A0A2V4A0E5_9BACT|nr:hypothetical protein [Marinifilum breve]PXY02046.1 hypothetical protein DF185_05220 [Marinifilum breve]